MSKTLVITLDNGQEIRTSGKGAFIQAVMAMLDNKELVIASIKIEYEADWMCDTMRLTVEELRGENKNRV